MFPLELFKVQAQYSQKCPHSSPKISFTSSFQFKVIIIITGRHVILFPLSTHLPAPKPLLFLSHVTQCIFIVLQTEWTTTTPLLEKKGRSCFLSHVRLLLGTHVPEGHTHIFTSSASHWCLNKDSKNTEKSDIFKDSITEFIIILS